MKHVFTFLYWLVLFGGLVNAAQAQTSPLIPSPTLHHQPINQVTTARSARQVTAATIRYVKAGASGTGTSWSNASGDLQAMINASAAGDQVWIAGGTYKPSTSGLTNARTAAFSLKNGVSVLGGFSGAVGSEGNSSTRTAMPSSTTLSGDIGSVGDTSDNSYHVINNDQNGLDNSAVIDGVTITGGNANGNNNDNTTFGGGMINNISSPTVNNCLFTQNYGFYGGGMQNGINSTIRVTNCYFSNNSGTIGALYEAVNAKSVITNCYFEQHKSSTYTYVATSNTTGTLINCTFRDNNQAIFTQSATVDLINGLLWSNGGANALQGPGITVSYSALETGATGYTDGGNNKTLTSSPFENVTGPTLKACAPAVDAGNDAANTTATDVLGNNRKLRTIDIGAAEFQGTPTQPETITSQSQSATTICAGVEVQFLASVTGTGPVTVTFARDNVPIFQGPSNSGTGSLTYNYIPSQSGSYQIIITSACNSVTTTYAPITVNPLPTSYTVTGGGAYCQGNSGMAVGLAGSQTGVNYQLLFNGNAVGSPVAGTGNALNFGNKTAPGTYTVRATNATTSCQQTMNGSAVVSVNPLPTVYTVTGGGAYCSGGNGVAVNLSGSQTGVNYQLLRDGSAVGSAVAGTGDALNFGNQTTGGSYSIRATNASTSCQQTMTGSVTVTVNPLPMVYAVTGGGAYCAGSNGIAVGLSGSQTGVNYQLQRDGNAVGSPVAGTGSSFSFGNQITAGTYTVLAINPSTSCQQAMSGSAVVSVTPLPAAPSLVTASGYPYPAGQSNLTISQNVGPVSLTASGCSGGMLTANGNAASSFTVTTANTGTQTYTATCSQNGCTGPAGSFQLTVVPTTLSVLHRDADYGQLTNNIIKPYLELANAGGSAISYGDITVRYWFTSEGNAPPTNLAVYYAQLGAVNMNYVALTQPRQGAYGYVEYSFPGGGSLGGNGNSGPIENGIQKTDGSNFDESDDYSYQANYQDYVSNQHVTAYRNGTIVWGQEPTTVASQTAVQVYTQAQDGITTSQIQTRVELRNTGNVALAIQDFRIRYYFTSDNNQVANVYVDYADIGASNIQARVIKLPAPVNGADSYVELRTVPTSQSLAASSSLGAIDFRLVRSDNGLFDQSNDYSFMANYGNVGLNNRVTVLLNNRLIFGTPPSGAPARVIAVEAGSVLTTRLLGNPVVGNQAQVEITGVTGQAVSLRLVDLQGRSVHEQRIEQVGETERVSVPLGTSRGQLVLKVSTDTQQQSLKLLRP